MSSRLAIAFTVAFAASAIAAGGTGPVPPATAHEPSVEAVIKTFAGVVEAVTLADPVRETRSEIVAVNAAGRRSSFLVTASSTIYDPAWRVLILRQIHSGDRVRIRYVTTADGLNVSRSVRRLGDMKPIAG
jgi:hypothetical protein